MAIMKFKQFITKTEIGIFEGAISAADIFKRENKKSFIDKAIKGELIDKTGNKIPKIPKNSELITFLNNTNTASPELNKKIQSAFGKSLTALAIDKSLNGFAKGGSDAPSGADWEKIICCAYNMLSKKVDQENAIRLAKIDEWKPSFNNYLSVGLGIVKSSFGKTPKGVMEHYGASTADLTKEWDSYFISTTGSSASGPTKTPKTDMYIGSQHISLKKEGGSQLMSGGKAETLATLAFAYANTPKKIKTTAFDKSWNSLIKQIEKEFITINLPAGKTIDTFKKEAQMNVKDKLVNVVKTALIQQDAMTKAIREILNTPEVNRQVVFEAMTGKNKFSENLPIATHMMKFSDIGKGEYKLIDEKLVSYYASKTKFNISFKTSGVGGRSWTALKGIVSEEKEFNFSTLDNLIEESYEETTQKLITEGILDRVGGAIKKGVSFLKSFVTRMLSNLWEKIKSIIVDTLEGFQNLFGVRMSVNNPFIMW
jgi:hypothetical protein